MVSQDIERLMALWADDALITDAQHTPDYFQDDQSWRGADTIRYRYTRVVFPSAPSSAQPSEFEIEWHGDRASVRSTTRIGDEESLGGDRWEVVKQNGCWLIQSLTYNLEAP